MPVEVEETQTTSSSQNPFTARFKQFFESAFIKNVNELVKAYPKKQSLEVDFKILEKFDYELADELLDNPDAVLQAAEDAIQLIEIPSIALEEFKPIIRVYNLPADREILLRDIGSEHANKLIAVEGIVKQLTDIMPRLKTGAFNCNRCGTIQMIKQTKDAVITPSVCECKARDFSLMANDSAFIDSQKLQIQESLEKLRGNEQPTNLDMVTTDDFVNKVTAGDKIKITGVLRLKQEKKDKLIFKRFLDVLHIEETARDFEEVEINEEEINQIKEFAVDPKIYDKLIKSVAPNIYGHEIVKESVILQLFGGVKKMLPDGGQPLRGNIHVLLVGDPGVAKSAILQASHMIAPKSIYVAGKGTTSAGLTATAVKDEFGEGSWTLKAGALVLASGGTVMADELDKMDKEDRSSLHEAMEQGMVSIAKAGIVTRFKTDTSILAAANPKFSRFDKTSNVLMQIDLPSTLISRFDLFFVIKDELDRVKDSQISMHILKTHQAGEIYSQHKKGKTIAKEVLKEIEDRVMPAINSELLGKYISYTRQNVFPVLTQESIQELNEFYVNLRERGKSEDGESTYAATHRQLEGLVRLSEASARIRLSDKVEIEDARRAIRLVETSLAEVITDPKTGKWDIDYMTSGQPQTMRAQIKTILNIVKEQSKEFDSVPIESVIESAAEHDISKDEVRDLIEKLQKNGDLYSPKPGHLKPTSKE